MTYWGQEEFSIGYLQLFLLLFDLKLYYSSRPTLGGGGMIIFRGWQTAPYRSSDNIMTIVIYFSEMLQVPSAVVQSPTSPQSPGKSAQGQEECHILCSVQGFHTH